SRLARRLRPTHRRGNRKDGQGGEVLRRQSGVTQAPRQPVWERSPAVRAGLSIFPNVRADFTELDTIAFARHGSAKNPPGDNLTRGAAPVFQAELVECARECPPYPFQVPGAERAVCSQVLMYRHEAPRRCAVLFLSRGLRQNTLFPPGLATKIIQSIAKFVT